jgi:hypothetical protein
MAPSGEYTRFQMGGPTLTTPWEGISQDGVRMFPPDGRLFDEVFALVPHSRYIGAVQLAVVYSTSGPSKPFKSPSRSTSTAEA